MWMAGGMDPAQSHEPHLHLLPVRLQRADRRAGPVPELALVNGTTGGTMIPSLPAADPAAVLELLSSRVHRAVADGSARWGGDHSRFRGADDALWLQPSIGGSAFWELLDDLLIRPAVRPSAAARDRP